MIIFKIVLVIFAFLTFAALLIVGIWLWINLIALAYSIIRDLIS